jgi:DNA modification methylase
MPFNKGTKMLNKKEERVCLYNDDCLNVFKQTETNSIDLIVTDPP